MPVNYDIMLEKKLLNGNLLRIWEQRVYTYYYIYIVIQNISKVSNYYNIVKYNVKISQF